MLKFLATVIVAAIAAAFAIPGAAQIPANAMALVTSAPQALPIEAKRILPPAVVAGPDPSTAWVMGIGFLAVVVLRRIGSRES